MTKHRDTGNIKAVFVEVEDEGSLERGLRKNGEARAHRPPATPPVPALTCPEAPFTRGRTCAAAA